MPSTFSSTAPQFSSQDTPAVSTEVMLRWVSGTPFGAPVVPEVYRITAGSSALIGGSPAGTPPRLATCAPPRPSRRSFISIVPGAGPVSCARLSRIGPTGTESAARVAQGISSIMFTETTVSSGVSSVSVVKVSACLSKTMATFAPWSMNWSRSS